MDQDQTAVAKAADRLVAAFGRHDTEAYFAAFAPGASFIFHNHPEVLASREDYRLLWKDWETSLGFKVLDCKSSDRDIKVYDDMAIFTHRVETRALFGGEAVTSHERETIVFRKDRQNGEWLAVHEHLSTMPRA
ncbi:MAG TPA: nuclear transport factor 2 family protein [Mesorhizobium sp.]|jgi:ketosteroid isomerase-like protein|uniref:YybH family protein n=1 Tax=Mesorhizobium sp. TaxID=1871066 RepID=UPI002DDCF61E|nr:nuclear transport factor 2 family protein [Mesorhizobium sp.]HEV2502563.1 nuclear transport factor 2 family protein [Mesorhizobium sp.]